MILRLGPLPRTGPGGLQTFRAVPSLTQWDAAVGAPHAAPEVREGEEEGRPKEHTKVWGSAILR